MTNDQYPALTQLFSCYFHQDWPEEFDSPDRVIDAFVMSESEVSVSNAKSEIKTIIDSDLSDDEILSLICALGCYYEPKTDHTNALSWLIVIRGRLGS